MPLPFNIIATIGLALALLLLSTVVFDGLHVLLHRWVASPVPVLRRLAGLHQLHHRFLDRQLNIHQDLISANVWCHVIPEYMVQVIVTIVLGRMMGGLFSAEVVWLAVALETVVFLLIMKPTPGFDINHRQIAQLKAYRPLYFCVPEYHLLHHVYPTAYFGSWIKTLDHLLKTGTALAGRQVTLSGADTPVGNLLHSKLSAITSVSTLSEAQLRDEKLLVTLLCNTGYSCAMPSRNINRRSSEYH